MYLFQSCSIVYNHNRFQKKIKPNIYGVGSFSWQLSECTDYADDADFADYRVCVHPIPIVACWVSIEVFARAGVGNDYNFLWLLTLGCKPFNPTYGTQLTPMVANRSTHRCQF